MGTDTENQMRADIERIRDTLDDFRKMGPLIHQMAAGLDTTRSINAELAQTIARLGATLDGLVNDIAEVRTEQLRLRQEHSTLAEQVAKDRVHNASLIERHIPIWAAVVAAIVAILAWVFR